MVLHLDEDNSENTRNRCAKLMIWERKYHPLKALWGQKQRNAPPNEAFTKNTLHISIPQRMLLPSAQQKSLFPHEMSLHSLFRYQRKYRPKYLEYFINQAASIFFFRFFYYDFYWHISGQFRSIRSRTVVTMSYCQFDFNVKK